MPAQDESSNSLKIVAGAAAILVVIVLLRFFVFSSQEASVRGTVTLDEAPLASAQVVFLLADVEDPAPLVAQTDDAGHYELMGPQGHGIPVGKYKVMVSKTSLPDGTLPKGEKLVQMRGQGWLQESLPGVYSDRASTPFEFDIQSGPQTIDLRVKRQP
jgi:hypothetical protein